MIIIIIKMKAYFLKFLKPDDGCGDKWNGIFINLGRFLSTTISTTHEGTVSFKRARSVSPAASRTNSLYSVFPPTSL